MFREREMCYRIRDDEVIPEFLGRQDVPWLHELLREYRRFVGRPEREFSRRIKEPFPGCMPLGPRVMASRTLLRLCRRRPKFATPPRALRAELFTTAAHREKSREEVVRRVAAANGMSPAELESLLFADLARQRPLPPLAEGLEPSRWLLEANLELAQSLLSRSTHIDLSLRGNARRVIRRARLGGLICSVTREDDDATRLDISGPYSLFRRTIVYGRSLAALLPGLVWASRYRLEAEVLLEKRALRLRLESGAPIFPGDAPKEFDSKVEERFAKDFAAATTSSWDLVREPNPVPVADGMIFPDFLIVHRRDPGRRWYLEIVGYWTPEYLRAKLEKLREAEIDALIVCVDDSLNCGEGVDLEGARVVRYRRRVDVREVLAIIDFEPGTLPRT